MNRLLNKIKFRRDLVRLRIYYFFYVQLNLSSPKKRILVLRNDSIGDYILFRNFLHEIKQTDDFKNHEIYFLTSKKMLPIVAQLDSAAFSSINILKSFNDNEIKEKIKYYKLLSLLKFEYIIHPTYSPNAESHQAVQFIRAKFKIGFSGDLSNQTEADKVYHEKFYTQLIQVSNPFSHEFEKNLDFFKSFLKRSLSLLKPNISINKKVMHQIIICPGAQHKYRIWSLQKFGQLINYFLHNYPNYNLMIATGPGEDALYTSIVGYTNKVVANYKIDTITNFIDLIAQSRLVVCNDSSAAHIAVACNVNSVCISNGNHYGRFVPYPAKYKVPQELVIPIQLIEDIKNKNYQNYYFGSTLDINTIALETVIEKCELYLNQEA